MTGASKPRLRFDDDNLENRLLTLACVNKRVASVSWTHSFMCLFTHLCIQVCGAKRVDIQSLRIVSIRIRVETGGVEVLGLMRANGCGAKGVERLLPMRCAFRSRASGMSHLQRVADLSVPN